MKREMHESHVCLTHDSITPKIHQKNSVQAEEFLRSYAADRENQERRHIGEIK